MEKIKRFLPAFISVIVIAAMSFTMLVASGCKKQIEPEHVEYLDSISLDTSKVKTEYYVGDYFDFTGLLITAHYKNTDGTARDEDGIRPTQSGVRVIDTAFNSQKIGYCDINVEYTVGGVTKSASYKISVSGLELEIFTDEAKTTFLTGESFDSTGIVVYRVVTTPEGDATRTLLTTGDYTVNSQVYKNNVEAEYEITLTHRYESSRVTGTYTVSVIEPRDGLAVDFAEGSGVTETERYTGSISLSALPENIADLITVKVPSEYGYVEDDAEVLTSGFDIKIYNTTADQSEVSSITSAGTYQIWVYLQDEASGNWYRGFVILTVG